jgi:hypothetical protein
MTPRYRTYLRRFFVVIAISAPLYLLIPQQTALTSKDLSKNLSLDARRVESSTNGESDLQNYKRPAYFKIFKFIISFLPASQR